MLKQWLRACWHRLQDKFGAAVRVERRQEGSTVTYWVRYRRTTGGTWHLSPLNPGPFASREAAMAHAKGAVKWLKEQDHKRTDAVVWEMGEVRW